MTHGSDQLVPTANDVNRAQREHWETEGARLYREHDETNEALIGPFGHAMLDAARLQPGEVVLDVGCGHGTSTLEAEERVAPTGRVVGVDISAAMLETARRRVAAAGSDNIELLARGCADTRLPGGLVRRCDQSIRTDVLRRSESRVRQPLSGSSTWRTAESSSAPRSQ